jgi:hypothetical protein
LTETRRIAANIAKLLELVRRCPPVVGGFEKVRLERSGGGDI